MKHLFLFLCLFLCFSCEQEPLIGDCVPITPYDFSFNSQEGIDSRIVYGYRWWFTGVQEEEEEECEFIKPERIECPWFSAEKAYDSIIIVSVKQNNTDQKRYKNVNIKGNDGGTGKCSENTGGFKIIQCPPDVKKLSKEELLFSAEGGIDSVTVTNNISSWLYLRLSGSGINGGPESAPHSFNPPYIVEGSWFTISIPDEKKVIFSVNKNETGKERNFIAILDPDICGFSSVKISQSAE